MQISEYDAYLFHEGTNYEIYQKMGAHPCSENGQEGTRFIVWAPNAKSVSVITEIQRRHGPFERWHL